MMVADLKTGGLVLHVLLCAALWYSVFCRAVREDKHVKVVVRLAFALLGMAALCAMVAPLVGVEPTVVSPAAISVSENILHGISVYRSNPTRFYVHVFPLFQGYLRPYARLDGKHMFYDSA